MKTYEEWESLEEGGMDLQIYLDGPCEIDEEIYCHLLEWTIPAYCIFDKDLDIELAQNGEAWSTNKRGTSTHDTILSIEDQFFYLGVYPKFKKSVDEEMKKHKLWDLYYNLSSIQNANIIIVEE